MGEVSLDNGYTEALIIYNGRTIEGVGGGVCQVSTTLFRTAFFAGFPIAERYPHAYRVSYYEKTAATAAMLTWPGWTPRSTCRWLISNLPTIHHTGF